MTPCSVDGCDKPVRSKGYCKTHYERQRLHGDPQTLLRPRRHETPPTCSEDNCDRPKDARGFCKMHYRRWRRLGTIELPQIEPHVVFMASVTVTDECWPWTGYIDRKGYGQTTQQYGERAAHRMSYELHTGPIPAGLQVDHVCHTMSPDCPGGSTCMHRRCVNPAHLELVTLVENVRRGHWRKGSLPDAGEPRAS